MASRVNVVFFLPPSFYIAIKGWQFNKWQKADIWAYSWKEVWKDWKKVCDRKWANIVIRDKRHSSMELFRTARIAYANRDGKNILYASWIEGHQNPSSSFLTKKASDDFHVDFQIVLLMPETIWASDDKIQEPLLRTENLIRPRFFNKMRRNLGCCSLLGTEVMLTISNKNIRI